MNTMRNNSLLQRCQHRAAFTMVESMLLVSILGMTAAVVGQSLSTMATSAATNNSILYINDALLNQMEILRSTYGTVSPAPTTSTPWTSTTTVGPINGKNYTMTSKISCTDPGTGSPSATFLCLQVTIDNHTMTNYISE